ncbi:MAG: acyl-CoA thioesterase [Silanimonas sp.]
MSDVRGYEQWHLVGWADMDFNAHMANTAYLNHAVDVRLGFFAQCGFPASELARHGIGPVVREDRIRYRRELRLHERVRIDLAIAGVSDDGSRFTLQNEFFREGGELAAQLRSSGGWLSLQARTLVAPPEALRQALVALPRTDDFELLPSL